MTTLQQIQQGIKGCTRCDLHKTRQNIVFGEGSATADLMFIGEGPGFHEDRTGRPFVGRAGELLDKMIAAMGLQRSDTYICNVVKCRPPNNRDPTAEEIAACKPFLIDQVTAVRPRTILLTGLVATKLFFGDTTLKMKDVRGRWFDTSYGKVMPIYHPAAMLRNEQLKRPTWEDLQNVMKELQRAQENQEERLSL